MIHEQGMRTTTAALTFTHPFRLGRDPRILPAGVYTAHTHEDVFIGTGGPGHIRTSVDLEVIEPGRRTVRVIRPADLDAALARDRAVAIADAVAASGSSA